MLGLKLFTLKPIHNLHKSMTKKSRPPFEAIDDIGLPYVRKAQLIGELPSDEVKEALAEATAAVAKLVGVEPCGTIKYGTPAFLAMRGMNRNIAKRSAQSSVLLVCGCDLSLDLCESYESEEIDSVAS